MVKTREVKILPSKLPVAGHPSFGAVLFQFVLSASLSAEAPHCTLEPTSKIASSFLLHGAALKG